MKTYTGEHGRKYFRNEDSAFRKLSPSGSEVEGIVGFYGSFTKGPVDHLLLESACQDLEQYLEEKAPPTSTGDIINFWTSISSAVAGVWSIHAVVRENDLAGRATRLEDPYIFRG